jgi:hypothetical protein
LIDLSKLETIHKYTYLSSFFSKTLNLGLADRNTKWNTCLPTREIRKSNPGNQSGNPGDPEIQIRKSGNPEILEIGK